MPRVTAGQVKNFQLKVPPDTTRPLTDRIKISIFDTLNPIINKSKCLDLYAGSGAFGIEAISRGASYCHFVESDPTAANILNENLSNSGLNGKTSVHQIDVYDFLQKGKGLFFDIIFADPPFPDKDKLDILKYIHDFLNVDGVFVFRYPKNEKSPEKIEVEGKLT